jgi:hypothetical protein
MEPFEIHLTFDMNKAREVRELNIVLKWKYSQIDGDPVLGNKVFCYLTTHAPNFMSARNALEHAVHWLIDQGAMPLRKKIEVVVYDDRTTGDALRF